MKVDLLNAITREGTSAVVAATISPSDVLKSFEIPSGIDEVGQRLTLPPLAMAHASGRDMQRQLLAWIDVGCSKQELFAQAGNSHPVLTLLNQDLGKPGDFDTVLLSKIAGAIATSGCRDISEGMPYNVLLWLLEAQENSTALRDTSDEWRQSLQQALAHEAWFKWHCGLWDCVASAVPDFDIRSPLKAKEWWQVMNGPMRLHLSTITAHALAVTASARVPIFDRQLKLLQLQLGGRHLRQLTSATGLSHGDTVAAELCAALIVAAVTIEAHLPELPADPRISGALRSLRGGYQQETLDAGSILEILNEALSNTSHCILKEVWHSALRPSVQILLSHRAIAARDARGKCFLR